MDGLSRRTKAQPLKEQEPRYPQLWKRSKYTFVYPSCKLSDDNLDSLVM